MIKKNQLAAMVASLVLSAPIFAQNVATVNGEQIPDAQFNQMLSAALARGQKDTLRRRINKLKKRSRRLARAA